MKDLKFLLASLLLISSEAIAQRMSFNEIMPPGDYAANETECSSSKSSLNISGSKISTGNSVCLVSSFNPVGRQVQVQMTCYSGPTKSTLSTIFEFTSSKHITFGFLSGHLPLTICEVPKSPTAQSNSNQTSTSQPSIKVVDNRSFDSLLPKGYYANSLSDCEKFRKDPTEDTVYGLIVDEKHIGYTHAGACNIRNYRAVVSNRAQVTADCGEAGESRRVTTNVTVDGNIFDFGKLTGGGDTRHYYCGDFRQEARKRMQQSYEASAENIARFHIGDQKKILDRIAKRNVICRAYFIKVVNPWNMYSDPKDPNRDVFAEFNVDFKDDAGRVIEQAQSKIGGYIEILSTQNDAEPSPTLSGKMIPLLLAYRNYFWPLEALSIDEKSCKRFRS